MLAGGQSSRFGSDKALALWRGQPLLDHAIATLAPWCGTVTVVGRDQPGQPRIDDWPRSGLGPLGGIAGAIEYAAKHEFDSVLTIACDMPGVPEALLAQLAAALPGYCADAPVLGHWPVAAGGQLIAALSDPEYPFPFVSSEVEKRGPDDTCRDETRQERETGQALRTRCRLGSVRRWAEAIGATAISAPSPLRNVNTPADLIA